MFGADLRCLESLANWMAQFETYHKVKNSKSLAAIRTVFGLDIQIVRFEIAANRWRFELLRTANRNLSGPTATIILSRHAAALRSVALRFPGLGAVSQKNHATPPQKGPVAQLPSQLLKGVSHFKLSLGRCRGTWGVSQLHCRPARYSGPLRPRFKTFDAPTSLTERAPENQSSRRLAIANPPAWYKSQNSRRPMEVSKQAWGP